MSISREQALRIRNLLDNWLPPILRDHPAVMFPLLRLALGRHWREFAAFKARGFHFSSDEFSDVYRRVAGSDVQGETDLNSACVDAILAASEGLDVLEVGCGRGYLVGRLAEVCPSVTGCDIVLSDRLPSHPRVTYLEASVESLPFGDDAFDTVICTHTLEHVQRIDLALTELRRVARRQVIIVVPRERPYRYSFNLHLHFFPYPWNWEAVAGHVAGATLTDLGDWFYCEPAPTKTL